MVSSSGKGMEGRGSNPEIRNCRLLETWRPFSYSPIFSTDEHKQNKGHASHPEVNSERGRTVTWSSWLLFVDSEQIKGRQSMATTSGKYRSPPSRTDLVHSSESSVVAIEKGK